MALASLFALALLAAGPGATVVDDAPIATAPGFRAVSSLPPEQRPVPATGVENEPMPVGAPPDDYGFVAWCAGALTGHMELYPVVRPALDSLPDEHPEQAHLADAEMLKAGREYMNLYRQALAAAEKASPTPLRPRGEATVARGHAIWDPVRVAEPKIRMWSWLNWSLPGRCETSAERLYQTAMTQGEARGVNMKSEPATEALRKAAARKKKQP